MRNILLAAPILLVTFSCSTTKNEKQHIGSFEPIDSSFNTIIKPDARIEILSDGHEWTEGPVWIESEKMLLFSDIPKNTIYKWTENNGAEVYLSPSGYTGSSPSTSKEPGSNGLTLDKNGNLILCQ